MIFYRSFILMFLLICCSFYASSQDSNYVYQDTSIVSGDAAGGGDTGEKDNLEMADKRQSNGNFETDTLLMDNQIFIAPDSIRRLKNMAPLLYAKDLDSVLFKYQQNLEKKEAVSEPGTSWLERFFASRATKFFFVTLAVVFVFLILYKLFFAENFFQRSPAKINVAMLAGEKENLSRTTDYGQLVAQAANSGDYRMAVRYHYLQSLQKLAAKDVIRFAPDKTNYQYLSEMSGKPYKNTFASLTLNYEYVWYGEAKIDEPVYNSIQLKFKQFNIGI